MKFRLVFIVLYGIVACSYSSWTQTPDQYCHEDELIERTHNIVLATVISTVYLPENGKVLYQFKTKEVIKGNAYGIDYFSIKGSQTFHKDDLRSFDYHRDPNFWKNNDARLSIIEDGSIRPMFVTGSDYLIFLGYPYHIRSFERIVSTKLDKWYQHVRSKVAEQQSEEKLNQKLDPTAKTPSVSKSPLP